MQQEGETGPFHPWRKAYKGSKEVGDLCPDLSHGLENQVRECGLWVVSSMRGALMERVGPHRHQEGRGREPPLSLHLTEGGPVMSGHKGPEAA